MHADESGNQGLRARPPEARPDRSSGLIWFVTDLRSTKEREIGAATKSASFSSIRTENAYLSITAFVETMRDREGRCFHLANHRQYVVGRT